MDRKIFIILFLSLIVILLWYKRKETYTSFVSLSNTIPIQGGTLGALFGQLEYRSFLLNELGKNYLYPTANAMIHLLDLGPTPRPYKSDDEITQIFANAYANGESSLNEPDRVLLRFIAFNNATFLEGLLSLKEGHWTSNAIPKADQLISNASVDGLVSWGPQVISDSGKSAREFLFYAISGTHKSINKILPSQFPKYPDDDDDVSMDIVNDSNRARADWVFRACLIPYLYVAWLVDNKWRIDKTHKSTYCPANAAILTRGIVPVAANGTRGTLRGPGTYTLSQLGNPLSIEAYGPVTVTVNKTGGGNSRIDIDTHFGCLTSADEIINDLTGVTNIVVS